MKKITTFFLYIGLAVAAPQRALKAKKDTSSRIKTYKHVRGFRRHTIVKAEEFRVAVEGVECLFCAESAVALVKKIDGVVEASYSQGPEGYEDGILVFTWDIKKGKLDRLAIEAALKEEEFALGCFEST